VLQHRKICIATSQKSTMKHEKWDHSEKHLLQQPKNLIATLENHLLQPEENNKKTYENNK
jgi:hypothetical protein